MFAFSVSIFQNNIQSLDAPGLVDDFYLNLIDWSCQNVVAVGFGQHVYQTRFENGEINEVSISGDDPPFL